MQDEAEMDKIRWFMSNRNNQVIDDLYQNMMRNLEAAGIENCEFAQTFSSANSTVVEGSRPTGSDKLKVRLFDNMELFKREHFPDDVIRKMKRLDKERDTLAKTGSVFDRLYRDSILKPLVDQEKQKLVKDHETNQWVRELLHEGRVLCSSCII